MRGKQRGSGRGPARSVAKERLWRRHIVRQTASGLSVRGYCARHAVSEPSFYAWRRELARRDRSGHAKRAGGKSPAQRTRRLPVEFVRLDVRPATEMSPIEIILGEAALRGAVVRVPPGADQATLARVLTALAAAARALPC